MTSGAKFTQRDRVAGYFYQETQLSFACGCRQPAYGVQNLAGIITEGDYTDFGKHFGMNRLKFLHQPLEREGDERCQICLAACLDMIQAIHIFGTVLVEVVCKGVVTIGAS